MFVQIKQNDQGTWDVNIIDDSTVIPSVIRFRTWDKEGGAIQDARNLLFMDTLTNLNPRPSTERR